MKKNLISTRAKTTSLMVLLVSLFLLSALAGVGKSAIAYTQYTGTLDGADWALRIPDPWNGMLILVCRGYAGSTAIPNPVSTLVAGVAMLNAGFAVAASSYGAAGFCLLKGVDSTYQLTNYIIDTYHVTGKIFLYGMSMGGSVVLLLGEKYPEVYSGVLDMYGGKDWKDLYTVSKRWANLSDADLAAELTALGIPVPPPGYSSLQGLRNFMAMGVADQELATGGTPETVPQVYEACSPTYHADIEIPVITVHGTADPMVPYYQSLMYQTAVANAGRSYLYRLYTVSGAGHGTADITAETIGRFNELVEWSNELTGSITLTPTTQAVGASVTVDGTGFGATKAVGIGFGAEVNVINETIAESGPYDVAGGPYYYHLPHVPVKPGTYRKAINISTTLWWAADADLGNGMFNSTSPTLVNGTINYVTGLITLYLSAPIPSTMHYINIANYTYYQYDVTPAAGVTTLATGTFQAAITVPNVFSRNYDITAIDTQGHIATAPLTVTGGSSVWDKTYGGTGGENGMGETLQTSDGGYVILGNTSSFGAGSSDFWLIKTDSDGNMQWNKTYGGALDDSGLGMCSTSDGGYALCGSTRSFGAGGVDFWLIKTGADGRAYWAKTYGGIGNDAAQGVVQTPDGGYALAGVTDSFGAGHGDVWLVKTDASGNMQWSKTYGGAADENCYYLVQAIGGGYAIAGFTNSSGAGAFDMWLVKTDSNGNMQWNKTYGGANDDRAFTLLQASDGGYALGGYTMSFGSYKAYLVKTDASGNMLWNKTYSTSAIDVGIYVIQTADGGYAIAGWNYMNGQDFILIKTDANGNMQWNKSFGGTKVENCYSLLQASDGGYVLTGNTNSTGAGGDDIWLVKTDDFGVVPEGLTIGVMMLLSAVAVIVSIRYFRKKPKTENFQVKL
jgi:pimeloyl-ACP methyl ester carboxylesterase